MAFLSGTLVLLAVHPGLLIGLVAGVLLLALVLWLVLAPGPQRARAVTRARLLLEQGKWEEAIDCYQKSLVICREYGDRVGEGITLENFALLCEAQGYPKGTSSVTATGPLQKILTGKNLTHTFAAPLRLRRRNGRWTLHRTGEL